jgi:hypothetical protein
VHERSDELSSTHATHIHANQQSQRRNGWWLAGKSVQRFSGFWQRKVPDKYCAFFGFSISAHTNFSLLADGLVSINKLNTHVSPHGSQVISTFSVILFLFS